MTYNISQSADYPVFNAVQDVYNHIKSTTLRPMFYDVPKNLIDSNTVAVWHHTTNKYCSVLPFYNIDNWNIISISSFQTIAFFEYVPTEETSQIYVFCVDGRSWFIEQLKDGSFFAAFDMIGQVKGTFIEVAKHLAAVCCDGVVQMYEDGEIVGNVVNSYL